MDFEFGIPSISSAQQNSYMTRSANYDKSNVNDYNMNNLNLQQQAMMNQFVSIAGCSFDQALYLLSSNKWQYQAALNAFFDESSSFNNINITENKNINCINNTNNRSANAPSNTPVTPPNLEFLEKAFSKLNSSFQDNPTSMNSNKSYASNTSNLNCDNMTENGFIHQNNNFESDMMLSNQIKKCSQLPFSEQTYLESARFNYYNN